MPVLVLVIMLASSNDAEPSAGAWIAEGARDALGRDARVLVEPRGELPSDGEALALADGARASVVVEVRWQDASHHRVHLHMHTTDMPNWLDRDIAFAREDDPADRGRTLGLAIGSMVTQSTSWPADSSAKSATSSPAEGPTATGAPPEAAVPNAGDAPSPASASATSLLTTSDEMRHPFSLSVEGMAGDSGGGDGAIFGGAFLTGWAPSKPFQLHLEGVARTTSLSGTGASAVTLGFGAGLVWYALRGPRFAFGPRLDLLALHDDVHLDSAAGARDRTRWVPASDIRIQGEWRASDRVAVSFAIGAELALGTARVYLGDQRITSLSPIRPTATLGVTLRF